VLLNHWTLHKDLTALSLQVSSLFWNFGEKVDSLGPWLLFFHSQAFDVQLQMAENCLSSVLHHRYNLVFIQNMVSEQLGQPRLKNTEAARKRWFNVFAFTK